MDRNDVLGLIPGTTRGTSRVDMRGGPDAQALRFEGDVGSRTVYVHRVIKRFAAADCGGVRVEEPCSGQCSIVEARCAMHGAALFACELARLLWSTVDLGGLNIRAMRHGWPVVLWLGQFVLLLALQVHAIDAFIDQSIQSLVPQQILPEQPAMQAIGEKEQGNCAAHEIVGPVHRQSRAVAASLVAIERA
ncbi:hypothetical protein [Bradyrhizobium acaciae]|uniref:hypothetical protein n=1 Tax=Bradyrhizobium acaciae TaxID=2683706 RepID=UPI001E40D16F|nr:hypothetical protein [Bradyrhizobium acaciae]MCC8984782.1 hypothetical protein [Bradyrhizobium acaciae]